MLWPLPLSFCTPINAPHGVITPLEDVFWKSHWECLKLSVWDVPRNSRGAASAVPGPGIWKCQSFCVFSEEGRGVWGELPGPVCRTTTDGQLDIYDASFWCHPHATYASPCSYDFLEIAFSQSLTAVTMATQSQLWGTDLSTYKHKQTPVWKPFSSPKSPHAQRDIPNPLSGSLLSA